MIFKKRQKMKLFSKIIILAAVFVFGIQKVRAQDGEGLFKAKCNVCHAIDKNSTGPILKGVKQKWNDAGEGEFLYEWVKNAPGLTMSGKSQEAVRAADFSPTMMPPQDLSNEEIDAILDFADSYEKPEPVAAAVAVSADGATENVKYVPNYRENLRLFYWLIGLMLVLLMAIILLSGSITSFLKSDFFIDKIASKKKEKDSGNVKPLTMLVALFATSFWSTSSYAMSLSTAAEAADNVPWLKVEAADLYMMVGINLALVGVLLYLKSTFKSFVTMVTPEVEKSPAERAAAKPAKKAMKKLNVILNDIVPIEEESKILMDHDYDGIQELDNNLPPWWVWMFWATIIFSFFYMFHYHVFNTGDLQVAEYNKEIEKSQKDIDAYLSKMAMNVDETNATVLEDASALASGKALYTANCVMCHNPNGEGNIGPNLTDEYWINGNDVKDIFKIIKHGNSNGMPEHASKLNPIQIQELSSYILSMPYAKGKEPEGDKYEK